MNWYPPWPLADRMNWAKARPWLAGFYFGLLMALSAGAFASIRDGMRSSLEIGAVVWPTCWALYGVGVKRRWGQRPDGDDPTPPTFRRPLSQMSDRWLSFFLWISALGTLGALIGLTTWTGTMFGAIVLALDLTFAWTVWTERRNRTNTR